MMGYEVKDGQSFLKKCLSKNVLLIILVMLALFSAFLTVVQLLIYINSYRYILPNYYLVNSYRFNLLERLYYLYNSILNPLLGIVLSLINAAVFGYLYYMFQKEPNYKITKCLFYVLIGLSGVSFILFMFSIIFNFLMYKTNDTSLLLMILIQIGIALALMISYSIFYYNNTLIINTNKVTNKNSLIFLVALLGIFILGILSGISGLLSNIQSYRFFVSHDDVRNVNYLRLNIVTGFIHNIRTIVFTILVFIFFNNSRRITAKEKY